MWSKGNCVLLMRKAAVRIHSFQNWIGTLNWKYKARATLSWCWCFLSTTEFYCGVSTHENWSNTLLSLKNSIKANSRALSDLKTFILALNRVVIRLKNLGRMTATSDFCLSRKIHVKRVQSSTKVRKKSIMWRNMIRSSNVTMNEIKRKLRHVIVGNKG